MNTLTPTHFTHLRVFSHYSLLRAVPSVADLVRQAGADGLSALALTDLNAMYGVVAFQRACRAAGIQPILGMTVSVAAMAGGAAPPTVSTTPGQLTLLAKGRVGYQSLCRLASRLQGDGTHSPRRSAGLSWAELKAEAAGLICIEAGQMGWLDRYVRQGQTAAAIRYAGWLGSLFAEDAYLGLELHTPQDMAVARQVIAIGQRFGLQPVAAQPVYTLKPEEVALLPLLVALDANCRREDVSADLLPAWGHPTAIVHWLHPAETAVHFAGFPDALANLATISQKCRPAAGDPTTLPDGRSIWPALKLADNLTPAQDLAQQAWTGLAQRVPGAVNPAAESLQQEAETAVGLRLMAYAPRLTQELAAITQQGFAPLFLVVADLVRFARAQDIPMSTRGSVANSLVAYALGITSIDPIEHGLLFERFLNPSRANLPDIDLDFCSRRRDEVLLYARQQYGADRMALIATMNTLQPKSAVREVSKALGLDEAEMKTIAALVPQRWHPDPRRREIPDLEAALAQLNDQRLYEAATIAFRLIGQPHHLSLHPGGMVLTPGPLTDYVPVQMTPKGFLATQYDFVDVEAIGLPKMDLLGIRALTVLADAADLIRQRHDPAFQVHQIPLDDPVTADLLARGDTIGVFQCESSGAQRTLRQLRARTVRDLAVANAFFKPGPATGGMARAFVRRYRGEERVTYLHPALRPILQPTQGVLLFQEQVLRIATEVAGLNWAQADVLRRGMSKFKAKEMSAMRLAFVIGCQRGAPDGSGLSQTQAETLWEQVMAFAGYGFNQGHATAYADVSYRSAYLRAHYAAEFLCARLADAGGFHHPVIYMAEAQRLGIVVRPPHVNVSGPQISLTSVEGEGEGETAVLWLGLGQVRDLRRESVRAVVAGRPFHSLRDLLDRVSLLPKEVHHLIQCGALDGLGSSRAALLAEAGEILRAGSVRQLAFGFASVPPVAETAQQRLEWERQVLGWPVSVHPLQTVVGQLPPTVPLRDLAGYRNQLVTVAGTRLPGWTGGPGWFLGDGEGLVVVRGGERPSVWEVVLVDGRYRQDEWGGGWLQVEE